MPWATYSVCACNKHGSVLSDCCFVATVQYRYHYRKCTVATTTVDCTLPPSFQILSTMMMMMMNGVSLGLVAILLALSSSHVSAEDVIHLTKDNFAATTEGKSVFIKFYAPWVSVIFFFSIVHW